MDKKKRIIAVIATLVVIVVVIIIVKSVNKKNNNGNEDEYSIVDNSIEVKVVTREERIENSINSTISRLEKAGATVTKLNEVTAGDAKGYSVILNGETIEIYYLEMVKLAKITDKTENGEKTVEINGSKKTALVYNDIFILNCNSSENQELITNTLSTGINR